LGAVSCRSVKRPLKKPLVVVTRKLPDVVETRMKRTVRCAAQRRRHADDAGSACRGREDGRCPGADSDRPDRCHRAEPGRPAARLIANFGNGVDNIDVGSATQRGITVTNTPNVLTEDTADMTMALILAVPRR
jgi:glyoxylate reductase